MNEDRDYFYRILGLQQGASSSAIKAAYRRLVKFYHPDRDKSPDAEIMYREIRRAYEKLLKRDHSVKTNTGTVHSSDSFKRAKQTSSKSHAHSKRTTGTSHDSRNSSKHTWTPEDWEQWAKHPRGSSDKKPFGLKYLPYIFVSSLEVFFNKYGFFALLSALFSCGPIDKYPNHLPPPHSGLVAWYHIIFLFFIIFCQYYYALSKWPFFKRAFTAILYGVILIFLVACFYVITEAELGEWVGLIWTVFWSTAYVMVLLSGFSEMERKRRYY